MRQLTANDQQLSSLHQPTQGLELLQISGALQRLRFYAERFSSTEMNKELSERLTSLEHALADLAPEISAVRELAATGLQDKDQELTARQPTRFAQPIQRDQMLVCYKSSKLSLDMQRFNETEEQALQRYAKEGIDGQRVLASHQAQDTFIRHLRTLFKPEQLVGWGELTPDLIAQHALLVMVGGDNHLQYGVHFLQNDCPVLGVNSDPDRSDGYLLRCSSRNFDSVLDRLAAGQYRLAPWSRLQVSIDGVKRGSALGELFIGESQRRDMSRHTLHVAGKNVSQRSSGLLICTGAGSTGWAASAGRLLHPFGDVFAPSTPIAKYQLTEPSAKVAFSSGTKLPTLNLPPCCEGYLAAGDAIMVESINDAQGIIALDSQFDIPFPRGAKAEIRLDPQPCWMVEFT